MKITFELTRQLSDRIHMEWEDDRGKLLQEIQTLRKAQRREKVTQSHLKRQISTLAMKMEEYFPLRVLNFMTLRTMLMKAGSEVYLMVLLNPSMLIIRKKQILTKMICKEQKREAGVLIE